MDTLMTNRYRMKCDRSFQMKRWMKQSPKEVLSGDLQ
jgi:hypothetical protein